MFTASDKLVTNSSSSVSLSYLLCVEWNSSNHLLYQLANLFLLFSFLSPNNIYGLLYLRLCFAISCLLMSLWAWLVLCSSDVLVWNIVFSAINLVYVACIVCKLHPFIRFAHDVEMVYRDLFQPLHVSRHAFKKIYSYTREIQTLKSKDIYAIEGKTPVDKLSLLLTGRVSILRGGQQLHIIDSHQFLDSPEWFGVGANDTYQVSIIALEESRLLVWHRDKLKLSISNDPYLQAVLDNILGKDVVKKLLLVTDSISNQQMAAHEQTKLIVPSHRAIDQLIKRNPINGNDANVNCFWNLSRITESDAETCV